MKKSLGMSAPLCFSFPVAPHGAGRGKLENKKMYIAPIKFESLDQCVKVMRRLELIEELKALQKKFNCLQVEEIDATIKTLKGEIVDLIAEDFGI